MTKAHARSIGFAMMLAWGAGCSGPSTTVCEPACPAGFVCTETGCVSTGPEEDLATKPPDMASMCSTECVMPRPYCSPSRQCVACLTDDHCPLGQVCRQNFYICVPGCDTDARCAAGGNSPLKCCGGQCLDTSKDRQNCGACGSVCTGPHSSGQCKSGQCVAGACDSGWANCNMNDADGCEVSIRVDPANCGGCGMACSYKNAVAGCANTCYLAACNFGSEDCNSNEMDGCETSVLSDIRNCGGCGKACNAPSHARATCTGANCLISQCDLGWLDCDQMFQTGCEINSYTDKNNCGKCGNVCPNGLVCVNGGCTCQQCNFPNAMSTCVNQVCVMGACNQGWGDCNNSPNDGCETNLYADGNNCGACFSKCPMNTPNCIGGMCSTSIHGSMNWQGFQTANNSCNMNVNGVVIGNYQWLNLGAMTWKNCMREASKRGAQTRAPTYGPWPQPGWFAHRHPNLSNLAMTGSWANYTSADINNNVTCILLVDPQSVQLKVWNTVLLANTTTYDNNGWHYEDYGVKFIDECELLAGKAGGSIITPGTIGLGTGDGYWLGILHTCSVYAWSVNGTGFGYDNTVQRVTQKKCMIGYMDN